MSRAFLAPLVVSVLVFNTLSSTAAPRAAPTDAAMTVAAPRNQSALPPGRAAGIKQAQGIESGPYWREAGLVIGAFVIGWLLMGIDDSDDAPTTTGQ